MDDPTKPKTLPTVTISATQVDPKKYRTVKEKVKLYPKGDVVDKTTIDSLVKAGRGAMIGQPVMKPGQMPMYGEVASDNIKRLMKK